ncbi:MAG TPA: hypothetical protein VLJ18_02070 [Thermoanaerobaculia bacterium]|nr:hypothetical protein [Thermoanaerobaculia bacterium]
MKKISLASTLLVSLVAFPLRAAESPAPPGPPKVLQIFREEVKAGKGAAHLKIEKGFVAAFARANWPTHYLALTTITGPTEAWFLTGYPSFAAWEKDRNETDGNKALTADLDRLIEKDGEVLTNTRSLVAILREDLSAGGPVDIAKMRYFRLLTFRVRPGHENDFQDAAKIVKGAYEKAKIDLPWAAYQITGGMPGPTFMILSPMKSLSELDAAVARAGALREAEGPENEKALAKMASDGYATVESTIFAFSPAMSYPSKEFVARDPEFWTPKPEAKPAAPAKKAAPEPKAEAKPADKK